MIRSVVPTMSMTSKLSGLKDGDLSEKELLLMTQGTLEVVISSWSIEDNTGFVMTDGIPFLGNLTVSRAASLLGMVIRSYFGEA